MSKFLNAIGSRTSESFGLFLFIALLWVSTQAHGQSTLAPISPINPNSTNWRDTLALSDEVLDNKLANSRQSTAAASDDDLASLGTRTLLAKSLRSLRRSFSEADEYLQAASGQIEEETDEAAFAQALRCQIEYRQALPNAKQQCEMLGELGFEAKAPSVLAFVALTQSLYLSREGKHELAEAKAEESTILAQTAADPALIALTNNWLGVQYNIKHLPKLSLLHFETAWDAVESLDLPELKHVIRFNSAAVYAQLSRHSEALPIFEEAINWQALKVSDTNVLILHSAMSYSLTAAGQAERAEKMLADLIPLHFDKVQDDTKILLYDALAQAQLAQNKLPLALDTFGKAIALLDKSARAPNPRGLAMLVPYGEALRKAGREKESLQVIDGVIAQLDMASPNDLLRRALSERAAILSAQGLTREAAIATAEAGRVAEQLSSEALNYQISRLKVSIELEQTNKQLAEMRRREAALQAETSREATLRNFYLTLSALLLAVAYLLFSRHLQARVASAERVANERLEEKVKRRTEQLEEQMADRMQAEVERRHLMAKLAEGEKMRALGQLTAGVAHDFNNLMTTVTLSAEYLKSNQQENLQQDSSVDSAAPSPSKEKHIALLDDILSATDSAARITGGLLAYARQQPLQPKVLQLDEFLDESTLIFRNTLGERILLKTSFEPCRVKVDQGQLASALLNLVLNAKEAIRGQGVVEICLKTELDPETGDRLALISVTDSGNGMTNDALTRATEPFYTTKSTGEGAGLGLSMVYGFARQSGGDLSISSEPGRGTEVILRLPMEITATQDSSRPSSAPGKLPRNLSVLVVEDRESVRNMLLRSLEHLDLKPVAANNADEARIMLDDGLLPDVLLTDLMMPGELDGQALASYARETSPALPIILMSGYSESVDDEFLFLRKPFNIDALEKTLLAALQPIAKGDVSESAPSL